VKFFWEVFVTLFVIIDPPGTAIAANTAAMPPDDA
jgi:small neutral amino acid transporter SnatA (MarC family)